jgi:SPOR domain/PilZ domain
MPIPERRQTPRTIIERLAYINIEPNNGGIVLNASEEGLSFHSIAPVERNGKLRFSLLEQNRRIEAEGELAWIDEAQKVGGLRFSALSSEARNQIDNWIFEPSAPLAADQMSRPSSPWHPSFNAVSASLPGTAAAPASARSRQAKPLGSLTGFSGGLAIGLLIAVLVTAGFLLHNNRSQVGESLIRIGQRLASKPQAQPPTVAQSPQPTLPPANARSSPTVPSAPAPAERPPQPKLSNSEPAASTSLHVPSRTSVTQVKSSKQAATPLPVAPPAIPSQSNALSRISGLLTVKPDALPVLQASNAADSGTDTSGATARMYFEVGKFKEQTWARKATDELAQLGFPATIAQKSRLWKNSYYVLVGPYEDRGEAEAVHKDLASHGFKPRPFERGSRNFSFSSRVKLNGTDMPLGDLVIRWESYVPDAKVKFLQNDDLVLSADGKWVDRGYKVDRNAFVYERQKNGVHTLVEIRFAGMSRVLVFSNPS